MTQMTEREEETLEENLTNILGRALNCVNVSISGRVIGKNPNGFIITVETEQGSVLVDINDGATDTSVFKIGDAITNLPLQGAYLDIEEKHLVFIFESPK